MQPATHRTRPIGSSRLTSVCRGHLPRQQLLHAPPRGQQARAHLAQQDAVRVAPRHAARVQQVVDGRLVEGGGLGCEPGV
jgi:hypothetical protein